MKLNSRAFAIAQTVAAAILYILCSALIALSPDAAGSIYQNVLHMPISSGIMSITLMGFFVGLLAVSIGWGLLSLVAAKIYNSMVKTVSQQ